ncbi:MAG: hypothetical protein ABSC89_16440 [Verrucomicrobiota bacterium]
MEAGGETQARRANKMRLETKPYVMQDHDLTNFRFNKQAPGASGGPPRPGPGLMRSAVCPKPQRSQKRLGCLSFSISRFPPRRLLRVETTRAPRAVSGTGRQQASSNSTPAGSGMALKLLFIRLVVYP